MMPVGVGHPNGGGIIKKSIFDFKALDFMTIWNLSPIINANWH
jgi:hypothetical protein